MYEGFIDNKQKRAQWEAKQAMDEYARQKEAVDAAHPERPTGLAGLLSNLTRDARAVGNTVLTTLSAVASPKIQMVTSLMNKAAQSKGNEELDKIAQKYGYKDRAEAMDRGDGPDDMWNEMQNVSNKTSETVKNISDNFKNNAAVQKVNNTTQSQYGADAIRTLRNAANVMGVGLTPVGGAIGGAAEGFADALENSNGTLIDLQSDLSGGKVKSAVNTDLDWGQAAKNAGVGALTGAVTAGVGNKIGNATSGIGSKLLNNRVATSAIGRGAIGGAVGGAVGGGLGAGLEGGDVLGGALQGAGSGALTGGIAGGLTSGARKVGTAVTDRLGVTDRVANARQALMYDRGASANRTAQAQEEPSNVLADEEFRAYGDSELANRTRRNQASEALSRFGNTLEGAQTNVTRAAARDLGIESTGKVVENVRKKTGLTNLETQATLAKELTGGPNSLMDTIQRNALAATEDGSPAYLADTTKLLGEVDGIVRKYANRTNMKGEAGLNRLVEDIRSDVLSRDTDLLSKANNFKASAAELRGKGIVNPSEGDSAKAKIYSEIGKKLDDLSYNSIPKENVEAMFDATINEMRSRAAQAKNNGNNTISKAYSSLANSLDEQPRTIQAYRSFKKDFVDVSNINTLTARAENGAGIQLGNSAAGAIKRFGNTLLNRPINGLLARAGGAVNSVADNINGAQGARPVQQAAQISPDLQNVYNILGLEIGMNEARSNASDNARNREFQNLEDQLSNTMAGIEAEYGPSTGLDGGYGTVQQNAANSQIIAQMETISGAMNNALAAGDMKAYSQLADLYKDAYDIYKIQNAGSGGSNLNTAEKNQLAKFQSAGTALDELENLYKKAGGGQGIIGGNIQNFLGSIGLNSDVNTYNQLAQGLINQIGAAIGKTDSLNTEGEVQRALSLVPKITDDNQTAMNKLASLRSLLQTNTNSYNQMYEM